MMSIIYYKVLRQRLCEREHKYGKKNTYGGFIHLPPQNEVTSVDAARALEAILLVMADKEPAKLIEE